MTPEDALARIPDWSAGTVLRELGGGFTNRSYLVRSANQDYVLRLDAEYTRTFGLDRTTEVRVLREAARAGIAPTVAFADPAAGILLCEYLPGPVWDRRSFAVPRNLELLAALMRAVHALPPAGTKLDACAAAERYAATASRNSELLPIAAKCLKIVRDIPPAAEHCCCHNDIVAANIVGRSRLRLLDWEYAGDNDPLFELASTIGFHDLDRTSGAGGNAASRLLESYTGGASPEAAERLAIQLRLFDALQWLWLAARYVIAPDEAHRARLEQLRARLR